VAVAAALVVAGCAEEVTVSPSEAVEIFVLDGLSREQAVCVVNELAPTSDLARMTGVVSGITEQELDTLVQASQRCRPPEIDDLLADEEQLDGDESEQDFIEAEVESESGESNPLDDRIAELIRGGLSESVAECVGELIEASPDGEAAVDDVNFLASALDRCR